MLFRHDQYKSVRVECTRPASGVTAALEPVVRVSGGVWIAHGSGDADQAFSDELGRLKCRRKIPASFFDGFPGVNMDSTGRQPLKFFGPIQDDAKR